MAFKIRSWRHIPPLRKLEADVPLPYVVEAIMSSTDRVELNMGAVVTIDSSGLLRNEYGTPLFRLKRLVGGGDER